MLNARVLREIETMNHKRDVTLAWDILCENVQSILQVPDIQHD